MARVRSRTGNSKPVLAGKNGAVHSGVVWQGVKLWVVTSSDSGDKETRPDRVCCHRRPCFAAEQRGAKGGLDIYIYIYVGWRLRG